MTPTTPIEHESATTSGSPPRPVLEFRDVELPPLSRRYDAMRQVNLTLGEGECAVVLAPPAQEGLPLADAALGLIEPGAGEVRFLGEDWVRLGVREPLARRALVGRIFDRAAWINNLNVLDNVLLPRRHHTTLSEEQLLADATRWARRFGLQTLPAERPSSVADDQLKLAEWVRAFSLEPVLLLLEHPMRGVARERREALHWAVAEARTRGAAVLWIASDASLRAELAGPGVSHYTVLNQTLVAE